MARTTRQRATGRTAASTSVPSIDEFQQKFELIVDNVTKVIKGKDDVIRLSLISMLAGGHILFEDYPGTGKTMLTRAIATTINASNSRVQCTPDLLPADVTGSPVLDRKTGDFVFRPGPIFANVLLADEVNRATPKTQSSLLEAMAEKTVTVDGFTHKLPSPFFVMATQNPVEQAGTFALPEAQLDRFLFKLTLGYAARDPEVELLKANESAEAIHRLEAVIDIAEVVEMMEWANGVSVADSLYYYIVDLCQATRVDPALSLGASSRASQALLRASKVLAASLGRDDVLPDDIKSLVGPVIGHRIMLTPDAQLREETIEGVLERLMTKVKIPSGFGRDDAPAVAMQRVAEPAIAS